MSRIDPILPGEVVSTGTITVVSITTTVNGEPMATLPDFQNVLAELRAELDRIAALIQTLRDEAGIVAADEDTVLTELTSLRDQARGI